MRDPAIKVYILRLRYIFSFSALRPLFSVFQKEKQVKSIERLTGQKQMLSQSFDFDVDVNQNKSELMFSRIRTGKSD